MTTKSEGVVDSASVGRLPSKPPVKMVTEELTKVTALLVDACPDESKISFLFDGTLRVFIDVRTLEAVLAIETILPNLGAGMFHDVQRTQAPRHGFGHRVSAIVER